MLAISVTQILFGKAGMLTILLSIIIFQKSYSQEVFKFSEEHFEITLPVDWKEIPKNEIDKNTIKAQKKLGTKKETNYIAGFQKRLSRNWFSIPYMLIQLESSGRISNSDVNDIIKSMDKVHKELLTSDNNKLRDVVKNLKRNEAYYEKDKFRIITSIDYSVNNSTMSGLFIMQLTSYGILNLFFYTNPKNWEDQYPEFLEISDNVKVDSAFMYENLEIKKNDKKVNNTFDSKTDNVKINKDEKIFSAKYDILFPLLNFLFFIIPFIIIFLLIRNTNIGKGVLQFTAKYSYKSSITVCLIFMLLQMYIANSVIFPLILNLLLIYPLNKFFIYCKGNSFLREDNVDPLQNSVEEMEKTEPSKIVEEKIMESQTDSSKSTEINGVLPEKERQVEESMETLNNENFICICPNCKNEIEVDEIEIQNKKYVCPECNSENPIEKYQVELLSNELNGGPIGIGGWLGLPAIGIVIGFLFTLGEIVQYLKLDQKTIPQNIIYFGLIENTILAIMIVVLAFYFYRKKKQAPSLFIAYLIISTLLKIVEVDQINSVLSTMKSVTKADSLGTELVRDISGTIFWSLYFLMSKRVKNTFVN